MTNKMRDILCSIIVIAFGAAMIYYVKDVRRVIRSDVGSAFVPTLIGWCIVITGGCKLLYSLFTGLKEESRKIVFDQDMLGGIGTVVLMVLYMLAFQPVGFVVASAAYLFLQMLLFSEKSNRKILLFAAVAVLLPLAVDALFVFVIKMPLPVGVFGFEG
ncbi:MAG: tripartite tricarboxylate transporter TctB family protein [Synergistaceae bacterium]|nr:tripartite tricarboxylate transporter TctB family protein [Synergistaceae bacterium]